MEELGVVWVIEFDVVCGMVCGGGFDIDNCGKKSMQTKNDCRDSCDDWRMEGVGVEDENKK